MDDYGFPEEGDGAVDEHGFSKSADASEPAEVDEVDEKTGTVEEDPGPDDGPAPDGEDSPPEVDEHAPDGGNAPDEPTVDAPVPTPTETDHESEGAAPAPEPENAETTRTWPPADEE